MNNSFKKILITFLIVGLNWTGISAVGNTKAMFNDVENSTENVLEAGVIDFTLTDNGFDPIEPSVSMGPGDVTKKIVDIIPDVLSNSFQYYASSTNFSGDLDFCGGLNVDLKFDDGTKLGGDTFYSTSLLDLKTTATTSLDSWMYEFGIGASNFQNRVCEFNIDYDAWQLRHNLPVYEQGGFSDTEKIKNKISSWGFRINKVYYDVAPDRGSEGGNEWVEIYNQTNVDLDISGWEICDNSSCDVLPSTAPIPAFGYGVVTASTTTWAFWNTPNNIRKIVLPDGSIGNRLGNSSDMLILKRPDGVVVDQMNWGTPNTSWNNYNSDVWNTGVADTSEGGALSRLPNGYDTDHPSDWQELTPPEVDLIYPDEAGSYTWYWNQDYDIEWTATNHNGDDVDLSIDISYIKDVNHDGVISDGDIEYPVVSDTANDGFYTWTVPTGFVGYIWIKLVATGPENSMLNDVAISGDIFDPIPVFVDNTPNTAALSFLNDEGDGELIDGDEMPSGNESQTAEKQTTEKEVIVSDDVVDTNEDNAKEANEDVQLDEEVNISEIEDIAEDSQEEDAEVVEESDTQASDVSLKEESLKQEQEVSEISEASNDETSIDVDENIDTEQDQANEDFSLNEEFEVDKEANMEKENLDEAIEKVVELVGDSIDALSEFVSGGSDDVGDDENKIDESVVEKTTEEAEDSKNDNPENTDDSDQTSQEQESDENGNDVDVKLKADVHEELVNFSDKDLLEKIIDEDIGGSENSETSEDDNRNTESSSSSEGNEDLKTDDVSVREEMLVEDTIQEDGETDNSDQQDSVSSDEDVNNQENNEVKEI